MKIILIICILFSACNVGNSDESTTDSNNDNSIVYLDLEQKEKCEKCGNPAGLVELGYEWLVCSNICPKDEEDGIDKECDQMCIAERNQSRDDCYLNFNCPNISE